MVEIMLPGNSNILLAVEISFLLFTLLIFFDVRLAVCFSFTNLTINNENDDKLQPANVMFCHSCGLLAVDKEKDYE
jgi:hypothetical protein